MFISPNENYYSQESERLLYRALTQNDIDNWANFFDNNPTQRFVAGERLGKTSVEKATNWINRQLEHQLNSRFGQLAVVEKSSGKLIGVGGIIYRDMHEKDEYEVTYSLLPDAWGKGYGTELALHFKAFAFSNIDTPSVISMIHVENEASINIARKNGMIFSSEDIYFEMPVHIYRTMRPK